MDNNHSVVITTTNSTEISEKIAKALLSEKLAACIQISNIKSYYTWKDEMAIDDEQILLIKCKTSDFKDIENCIKSNHTYEIPEIIMLPINDGLPAYLNWINEVTR